MEMESTKSMLIINFVLIFDFVGSLRSGHTEPMPMSMTKYIIGSCTGMETVLYDSALGVKIIAHFQKPNRVHQILIFYVNKLTYITE